MEARSAFRSDMAWLARAAFTPAITSAFISACEGRPSRVLTLEDSCAKAARGVAFRQVSLDRSNGAIHIPANQGY